MTEEQCNKMERLFVEAGDAFNAIVTQWLADNPDIDEKSAEVMGVRRLIAGVVTPFGTMRDVFIRLYTNSPVSFVMLDAKAKPQPPGAPGDTPFDPRCN